MAGTENMDKEKTEEAKNKQTKPTKTTKPTTHRFSGW